MTDFAGAVLTCLKLRQVIMIVLQQRYGKVQVVMDDVIFGAFCQH